MVLGENEHRDFFSAAAARETYFRIESLQKRTWIICTWILYLDFFYYLVDSKVRLDRLFALILSLFRSMLALQKSQMFAARRMKLKQTRNLERSVQPMMILESRRLNTFSVRQWRWRRCCNNAFCFLYSKWILFTLACRVCRALDRRSLLGKSQRNAEWKSTIRNAGCFVVAKVRFIWCMQHIADRRSEMSKTTKCSSEYFMKLRRCTIALSCDLVFVKMHN